MEVVNAMMVRSEPATFLLLIGVNQANHTKLMGPFSGKNNTRKRIHPLMPRSVNLRHSFTVQRTTDTRSVL